MWRQSYDHRWHFHDGETASFTRSPDCFVMKCGRTQEISDSPHYGISSIMPEYDLCEDCLYILTN